MNRLKVILTALIVLGGAASGAVWAHHGRVGVYVGVPAYGWYYPPPYYYYPSPPVVVQESPPVYIERSDDDYQPPATAYWYYCRKPAGYYPSVKSCPAGWEPVPARPPGN